MFGIIRLIIGCVILIYSSMVIKKSKMTCKWVFYAIFATISMVLVVVLSLIPFENAFVTFDSPKAAYEYVLGRSNIKLIVEGNNSDLVIDRNNDTDRYMILPKSADGWKIGIGVNTKKVVQKISDGIIVYVYQYKNTNDYFITIFDSNGGEAQISADFDTVFYALENEDHFSGKKYVTYYAYIPDFQSKYSVVVNGNKIVLQSS